MPQKKPEDMTREELLEAVAASSSMMQGFMKAEQAKKVRNFKELNAIAKKGQILFTGSSLMEQFPVEEYAIANDLGKIVYNRGIGGTTTDDFLREIDAVLFDLEPSRIFINIGTNDINARSDGEYWQDHLLRNYENILQQIKERLPEAEVYMMAYYPVHPNLPGTAEWAQAAFKTRTNEALNDTNAKVKLLAEKYGFHYIDVNDGIKEPDGQLRADITVEGMHMYAGGYASIYENLKKYL